MALIPWKREARMLGTPLTGLQSAMNELFESFRTEPALGGFPAGRWVGEGYAPCVDVAEDGETLEVTAELPGLEEKDIDVSVDAGGTMLTIRGEKHEEKEGKGKNWHRVERAWGSFSRTVPLPCEAELDKVDARFKNGVLSVRLPKTREAARKARHIEVKHG